MYALHPRNPEELAEMLGAAGAAGRSVKLGGRFTKDKIAGPIAPADVTISTRCLSRVLQYDPRDLTISVEAGMPFTELSRLLAANRQMIPLDPHFSREATVGGVLAANISGPRRRLYGTARDLVIGMKFATLEGKLVESGGLVVKNVAGLDMAKLMIGSFGTLAAIAVANFKLAPMPEVTRTFLLRFASARSAITARDSVLRSVLRPASIDLLNPKASARLGRDGYLLALQAGGRAAVIDRYTRELGEAEVPEGPEEEGFWQRVREFTPEFLAHAADGAVVRVSCTLSEIASAVEALDVPVVARAGSGVAYAYFSECEAAGTWVKDAASRSWKAVIEFAPPERKHELDLWPAPGGDLAVMKKVKAMFDPRQLLNRGRLYGRI